MTKIGRPLKYTPEELQILVNKYFDDCDKHIIKRIYNQNGDCVEEIPEPYTITGLVLALDTNRETLNEWLKNEDKPFSDILKKAHLEVVKSAELGLISGKAVAGEIFRLKNMDKENWRDKQETEITFNDSFADQLRKARERLKI